MCSDLGNSPGLGVEEHSDVWDSAVLRMHDHSELRDLPAVGEWQCSEVGDPLGLRVRQCSEVGDRPDLGVRQCSEVGDPLGPEVWQCFELGDLPGEQVCFGLAQEYWPAEHFGQLGQHSVLQLLQYSTGTEVVR